MTLTIKPAAPKKADHLPPIRGASAKIIAAGMGTGGERRLPLLPSIVLCACIAAGLLFLAWEWMK